jgi:hypothetical protein
MQQLAVSSSSEDLIEVRGQQRTSGLLCPGHDPFVMLVGDPSFHQIAELSLQRFFRCAWFGLQFEKVVELCKRDPCRDLSARRTEKPLAERWQQIMPGIRTGRRAISVDTIANDQCKV